MTKKQALGYAVMALKSLNINSEFISYFEQEMKYQMEYKTIFEAEEEYRQTE